MGVDAGGGWVTTRREECDRGGGLLRWLLRLMLAAPGVGALGPEGREKQHPWVDGWVSGDEVG